MDTNKEVVADKTVDLSEKYAGKENPFEDSSPASESTDEPGDEATEDIAKADLESKAGEGDESKEGAKADEGKGEEKKEEGEATGGQEPDGVDLKEFFLDGEDKSVADLLKEREQLSERIKAIDGDEFLKGFIEHYLATGDAKPYLESQTIKWDEKSPVDVIKAKMMSEYSDLEPNIAEKRFRKEFISKYAIDPSEYSSLKQTGKEQLTEDQEIGMAILERDANKGRQAFKEDQKKFSVPDKKQEQAPAKQTFDVNAWRQSIMKEKSVSDFLQNKTLKVGDEYGLEIESPDAIIEMMVDDRKFWQTMVDPKSSKVDFDKTQKVFAYAQNPTAFEKTLIEIGKDIGKAEYLKERKNISSGGKTNPPKESHTGPDGINWDEFRIAAKQQKKHN